jgi:hypothetical protein
MTSSERQVEQTGVDRADSIARRSEFWPDSCLEWKGLRSKGCVIPPPPMPEDEFNALLAFVFSGTSRSPSIVVDCAAQGCEFQNRNRPAKAMIGRFAHRNLFFCFSMISAQTRSRLSRVEVRI